MSTVIEIEHFYIPAASSIASALEERGITVDPAQLEGAVYGMGYEPALNELYADALAKGRHFNDMATTTVPDDLKFSDSLGAFLSTVERFQLDFDGREVFKSLNLSINSPRNFPTINYAALVVANGFSPLLVNELIQLRQKDNSASYPYVRTIRPALDIVDRLKDEGQVITMEDALTAATFWTPDEVLYLYQNNIVLEEAIKLHKSGVLDTKEIVDFKENIPEVWMEELFND